MGTTAVRPGRPSDFEVAVTGFRRVRDDAEGDELAGRGGRQCALDRGLEGGEVLQHVIGGQHQHQRVVAGDLQRRVRGQRDGRRGVAAHGL